MKLNINTKMAAIALALAGMGMATSCTDTWDDHYQAEVHGDGTLWQAIVKDGSLSNFATLIEAVDMKKDLDGSQMFTVFAPTNDVFTKSYCDELIASYKEQKERGVKKENNTVVKEFVQNHIALYNYSVSSLTNDSIVMMNGKYQVMSSNNLGGASYGSTNYQAQNGVLFTVGKFVPYSPNIYEYLVKDADLSNASDFIHYYDVNKFMASMSVPGEIINGQTHYLDSVVNLQNIMFSMLGRINTEDSLYYVLLPNNEVWNAELERNQKLFCYDKTVDIKDSLEYLYPRLKVLEGAIFSMNVNYDTNHQDTLTSTPCYLLEAGKGYVAHKKNYWFYNYTSGREEIKLMDYLFGNRPTAECSNGKVFKVEDQWPFTNALLSASTIEMEAEDPATLDSVFSKYTKPLNYVTIGDQGNPFYDAVSEHKYAEIEPKALTIDTAYFNIYNVLSNVEYEISVVTVPSLAADTTGLPLKNAFRAQLLYHDESGQEVALDNYFDANSDALVSKAYADLETSGTQVDTLLISRFTFPTCSYGLEKAHVKIKLYDATRQSWVNNKTHTRTMSIDKFVLRPVIKND